MLTYIKYVCINYLQNEYNVNYYNCISAQTRTGTKLLDEFSNDTAMKINIAKHFNPLTPTVAIWVQL